MTPGTFELLSKITEWLPVYRLQDKGVKTLNWKSFYLNLPWYIQR